MKRSNLVRALAMSTICIVCFGVSWAEQGNLVVLEVAASKTGQRVDPALGPKLGKALTRALEAYTSFTLTRKHISLVKPGEEKEFPLSREYVLDLRSFEAENLLKIKVKLTLKGAPVKSFSPLTIVPSRSPTVISMPTKLKDQKTLLVIYMER